MLSRIATGTVRYRRLILGVGTALAVAYPWVMRAVAPAGLVGFVPALLPFALALASWVLASLVSRRPRPAMFAVDPRAPAFRTVPDAGRLYSVLGWSFYFFNQAVMLLDEGRSTSALDLVLAGLLVVGSLVGVVAEWCCSVGVRLRPDGLVDRELLGSLLVPWEALAPGYPLVRSPSARWVTLSYAGPELVRRRGLAFGRSRISTEGVDPRFLSAVIAYYVAYPQCRAEIGTPDGHDRLRRAFTGQRPWDDHHA